MQWNLRIVLWLVLAAFAHTARADNPQSGQPSANGPSALKNLSLEQLSQIEVTTPSKEPTKVSQTPAAIYVITGEDIRRSGATCIPEALRLAPGVEVARIDSNKWSIGIRGFGSRLTRSVLVLIDGRTVYTPLFDGTYWEVQDTMMEDIDRIEVIRGPGGTIWGPNAVNGVINIITKSAQDTQGMLATVGGGDFEQGFADFRYGGGKRTASTIASTARALRAARRTTPMAGTSTIGEPPKPDFAWIGRRAPRCLHRPGRRLRRDCRRERAGHQLYAAVLANRRRQRLSLRLEYPGAMETHAERRQRYPGAGLL